MDETKKILIYGYGNPGRQDDGLGNSAIEELDVWLKEKKFTNIALDSNYQLNIEDAADIADKDIVIFVDASEEPHVENFVVTRVEPTKKVEFTMHAVSPGFVLNLCNQIYNKMPATYLVHIRGYKWEMKEELTDTAQKNLAMALDYIKKAIKKPQLLETTEKIINL